MSARLDVLTPDDERLSIALDGPLTLGRGQGCGLRLPFEGISREHARVEPCRAGWRVRDLRSRNGTFVNERRVAARELRAGDALTIGAVNVQFVTEAVAIERAVTVVPGAVSVLRSVPTMTAMGFQRGSEFEDGDALRADYDTLRAAYALSRRIGAERDVYEALGAALAFCFDALEIEDGAVFLESDGELLPAVTRRSSGEVLLSAGALEAVRETGRDVLLLEEAPGADARQVLAVPLRADEAFRGAIILSAAPGALTERDLHILSGVAAQASLSLERAELMATVASEARKRAALGRFLSPAVIERIERGELSLERGGHYADVVVLFCDVRGFTRLSGVLGPARIMALLNALFEEAVAEVERWGGVVDKFVGDELMAVWGLPVGAPDDAERALRCAAAIQERAAALSLAREARGEAAVRVGIGVDAGRVMAGLVGASQRLQYTVIGDAVNLAARLCGRAEPGEIVARTALLAAAGIPGEALPDAPVRGVEAPPPVSRVVLKGSAGSE